MLTKLMTRFLLVFATLYSLPLLAAEFDHGHTAWESVLSQYVEDAGVSSRVKYAELKTNHVELSTYLAQLSAVSRIDFDKWTALQQLAFLINAYNAFTLKLVVDHYPVESIKDIGSFFRSSWRIEFIQLLGETMHLDHIEHDLIRGPNGFNEPRIHFALVCASIGCPKLQAHAYTAEQLDAQLAHAAQVFLTDVSRNHYSSDDNTLYLSPLFKWYAKDFVKSVGSVAAFVAPYLTVADAVRQRIAEGKIAISYTDYDWSLNNSHH